MGRLGLGLGRKRRMAGSAPPAPGGNQEAAAYITAMPVAPDEARKALIAALVDGLKADGVWAKLDWLSLLAAHDGQAAQINARDPARGFALVGSPSFLINRGYRGTSNAYLASNWNPSGDGVNFQRNSAFIAAWSLDNAANNNIALGNSQAYLGLRATAPNTPNHMLVRLNGNAVSVAGPGNSLGLFAADRSGASTGKIYRNGIELGNDLLAQPSAAPGSESFFGLARNVGGAANPIDTARRYAALAWGGHLTSTQHLALHDRLHAYLAEIGAV